MKPQLLFMAVLSCLHMYGQQQPRQSFPDTTNKDTDSALEQVIYTATKFNAQKSHIAQQLDVISARYIKNVNAQNTGDLLISTGNVFVQKSQQGGSSPVIRGFEASRVLLVVDGIRMNNAIYRAGHLQNVITIDQNMLDRAEVMYGPSSTLYGSDALGGTIHVMSKQVKLAVPGEKFTPSGNMFVRYSSVNNERSVHGDFNLGYKRFGWMSSITYSDFGDMKMGSQYHNDYPDFGRRSTYVTQINNSFVDTVVNNNDDRVQRHSGYRQWDVLQKLLFQQNDKLSHQLNIQLSNCSNIPRYDRLQDIRNGTLRYADWYYGPQKRNLYAYTFRAQNLKGLFNEVRAIASYQDIEESRQTRDYQRYDRFDSRREHIKVWGAVIDTRRKIGNHEITIGADAQWNDLQSVADRTNLLTGEVTKLDSRYPNGTNHMNYYGLFAQHTWKMKNPKWVLNDAMRLQAVRLHSSILDNSFFNLPVTDIKQDPNAVTGNVGVVHLPSANTKLTVNLSSGFRAPNIDDLARIFESSSSLQRVVIPNPNIRPEYTYGVDAGAYHKIGNGIRLEVSLYYTLFRNAIALSTFRLNGQDSIMYNGTICQVVANQNQNKAHVYGASSSISVDINEHFSFASTINYTRGRFKTDIKRVSSVYRKQEDGTYSLVQVNVSKKPLDHIPPVFGKSSLKYKSKKIYTEVFAHYNGWKRLDEYNADGEDNAQYATADGMPPWITLNIRSSYTISENFELQVAVENIFDRNYRYFGSGFSAPGRNFMIAVRSNF